MAITRLKPTGVNSTATFTMANLTVNGNLTSANANLGNTVTANYFTGVLTTTAQPNISSVGTLSSLTSGLITATSGGIKVGNIQDPSGTNTIQLTSGSITITGNITAGGGGSGNVTATYFIGDGSQLTGLPASYSNTNVASYLPTYSGLVGGTLSTGEQPNITSTGTLSSLSVTGDTSVGGNITITGNMTVSGTTTTVNSTTVNINDVNIVLANNASTASQANGGGITINGASASMIYNSTSNSFVFSHPLTANGSLLTNLTGSNVTGQVGNALIAGTVYSNAQPNITSLGTLASLSVTGNVSSGAYLLGNGYYITGLPASYSNANVQAYLPTYTGNISAAYFIGNGATITYITGSNVTGQVSNSLVSGTVYNNNQSNITSVGTLANLTISGILSLNQTTEVIVNPSGSTYNFSNGAVFYTTSATAGANFTPNFTNIPTTDNRVTLVSIIVNQGVTPYLPTLTGNIQIDGANYTVKWGGGTSPSPNANSIQTFTYSMLRTGANWYVSGSSQSYY